MSTTKFNYFQRLLSAQKQRICCPFRTRCKDRRIGELDHRTRWTQRSMSAWRGMRDAHGSIVSLKIDLMVVALSWQTLEDLRASLHLLQPCTVRKDRNALQTCSIPASELQRQREHDLVALQTFPSSDLGLWGAGSFDKSEWSERLVRLVLETLDVQTIRCLFV